MIKEENITQDNVNHPYHYEGSTSLECIDVMKLLFGDVGVAYFCMCNAFKYMWRYKNKNGREDLDKAEWYLNHTSPDQDASLFSDEMIEIYDRLYDTLIKIKTELGIEEELQNDNL